MADVTKVKIADGDSNGLVVCLPGILARSEEQYAPLAPLLSRYGEVIGFDYDPKAPMDSSELSLKVQAECYPANEKDRKVTMIGSSMGGMQLPFILRSYRSRRHRVDMSWLRKTIIVDAPTGAETMEMLPNFAASPLASSAGRKVLDSSVGDKLIAKMSQPPKDDEITIPSDDAMRQLTGGKLFSEVDYKAWVKATAIEGLTGYSGLLWWSQMRWMINAGKSHQLEEAVASLHDLDVTYLACTHPGNGVVAQPAAADLWLARVSSIKRAEVYGTHCGYLQNQPEFAAAFEEILAR